MMNMTSTTTPSSPIRSPLRMSASASTPSTPLRMGTIKTLFKKGGSLRVKRRRGDGDSLKEFASPSSAAGDSRPSSSANSTSGAGATDTRLAAAQQQLATASAELDKAVALYLEDLAQEKQTAQARLLDACFEKEKTVPAFAASLADAGANALVVFVDGVTADQKALKEQKTSVSQRVYGFVDLIKPFLRLAIGVAADAAELAPGAGLPVVGKGVVGVFGILLDAVASEQQRSAEIPQLLGDVAFQVRRVVDSRQVQAQANTATAAPVSSLLLVQETELLTASTVFLRHVLERWRHGTTHNMLRSAFSSTYDDARRGLVRAVDRFNQALDTQVLRSALQSQALLAQLAAPTPVASWLQAAFEPVAGQFDKALRAREEGTCLWVLSLPDFCAWRQGPAATPNSLFWLNALPGTGKSTITAFVVQSLLAADSRTAAVAFFFCSSTNPALRSLVVLVRTVAAQLAAQLPQMQAHLACLQADKTFEPCDPRAENDATRARRLFDVLIRDGLRTNTNNGVDDPFTTKPPKDVFIVLDGLDELDQTQDLSWLLTALRALPAKVLVSSRREWPIVQALQDTADRQHCVTADEVRADIRTHVDRVLESTPTLAKALQHPQIAPLVPDPVALLTDKADGNFQYARLVLDDLTHASEDGVDAFETALESLPAGVHALYDRILARLARDGFLDTARAILACLLFSYRPLAVAELEGLVTLALGRDPQTDPFFDFARTVEKHCGVVLQRVGDGFAIAHETFKAYMTEPGTANPYPVFYLPANAQLAVACMRALDYDPVQAAEASGILDPAASAPAAWNYASWGWCFHMGALNDVQFIDTDTAPLHLTRADMLGLLHCLRIFLDSPGIRHWVTNTVTANRFVTSYAPALPDILGRALAAVTSADGSKDNAADDDDAATLAAWLTNELPQAIKVAFCRSWLHTEWDDENVFENVNKLVQKLLADGDIDAFASADLATQLASLADWARLGGWTPQAHGLPAGNYASSALAAVSAALSSGTKIDASLEPAIDDHESRLQRAVEDVPECLYWRRELVHYLALRDRVEEALAVRKKLVSLAPTPLEPVCFDTYRLIGKGLVKNNRPAEAETIFRLAITTIEEAAQVGLPHPDARIFWVSIANAWRMSSPEREIAVLREALDKDQLGTTLCSGRIRAAENRAKAHAKQAEDKQNEATEEGTKQVDQAKPLSKTRARRKTPLALVFAAIHAIVFLLFSVLFGGGLFMCYETSRALIDG